MVGSVGSTETLYSNVYSADATGGMLKLAEGQNRRSFVTENRTCTYAEFTIYGTQAQPPKSGILSLSLIRGVEYEYRINISDCPVGFSVQNENVLYGCDCGGFFREVEAYFQCNSVSGHITREEIRSWLSLNGNKVEHAVLCLPTYCNRKIRIFNLTDTDILCTNNHAGRSCGACVNGLSRVFGSNSCKRCSNAWLATIVLYSILGITLVMLLLMLRLTVAVGAINGVIFFCNVISINEELFFNTSQFSFLRVVFSLVNLDLGFEVCFFDEMPQIAKTGLQFVFPVYLWLLILLFVLTGKCYFRRRKSSPYSIVPVLVTLILMSYSKLLRTTVNIFSFTKIHYASNESNYNTDEHLIAWQPDPNLEYLQGWHAVLLLIALAFLLLFVVPFALASTFPKIILRSKKMSYFFPLLDCFYAPYKDKYRYWLGIRLIILIYLSGVESIIFAYQEALLLSTIVVVVISAILQAYIRPFKNPIINMLDLSLTGIFILLSVITLYSYPSTYGYGTVSIAVNILGSMVFFLICLVILGHINNVVNHAKWHKKATLILERKFETSKLKKYFADYVSQKENIGFQANSNEHNSNYIPLQESFLEEF